MPTLRGFPQQKLRRKLAGGAHPTHFQYLPQQICKKAQLIPAAESAAKLFRLPKRFRVCLMRGAEAKKSSFFFGILSSLSLTCRGPSGI